ncbi:MAG: hypothetical protein E7623_06975, partial [Ruminococcaceae bacterium]|nr:hypothetical protein [Oscillospiraceae bacterium]
MAIRKTFLRVIALLLFMTTLTGTFATGILAARDNRYDREENVTLHWCYDYVSTSNDHTKNLNLATVTYNGSAWGFGGTQTLSGNGSADIIVTPAEGYRIVSVDSLCSTGGSGNRANPYSCRTYNEGAAYNATPSIGSKNVNISGFTVATACNHSSHASNYFVMITVEKVSEEDNTPVYYSVSYEAGEGTGESYTDGELQFADEYTVDEFGFAAPEGKVFAGWKVTECEDNSAIYDINGNTYAAGDKFAMPAGNVTLTAQYVEDESKEEEGETISIPVKFYVLNPEKTVPLDGADQGINSYYPGGIVKNFRYYYEANIEGGLTDAFLAKLAASDGDNKLEIGDMLLVTSNEGIILPTDWKGLWTEFNISSENVNITAYVVKVQEALDYVGSNGNYYGYDDNGKKADIHVDCFVTNLSVKVSYHPNFEGAEDVYSVDAITGKVHEVFDYAETQLPENSGYKFIGWALSERGAVEYTADDNFTVVGNTDLYAKWEKIEEPEPEPVYYTVTYDPGEGTGESYADDGLEEKDRYTVDEFGFTAPVGFEFDKWVVTYAPVEFEATEFRGGEDFTMPAGDIVLTAVYKNVFYTVTYEAGEGSGDSYADEGLKMNDAYTVDEFGFTAPVGFEFDKWVVTSAPEGFEAT